MKTSEAKPVKDKKINGFDEFEIDDAARTLLRAEEIKQDPKLMEAVKPKLEKQAKAVVSAAQILYGNKDNTDSNQGGKKDESKSD